MKLIALGVETVCALWLERCEVIHDCVTLKVKVEDNYDLLLQVKQLHSVVEIKETNVM